MNVYINYKVSNSVFGGNCVPYQSIPDSCRQYQYNDINISISNTNQIYTWAECHSSRARWHSSLKTSMSSNCTVWAECHSSLDQCNPAQAYERIQPVDSPPPNRRVEVGNQCVGPSVESQFFLHFYKRYNTPILQSLPIQPHITSHDN